MDFEILIQRLRALPRDTQDLIATELLYYLCGYLGNPSELLSHTDVRNALIARFDSKLRYYETYACKTCKR
jgi:hypothetical protein